MGTFSDLLGREGLTPSASLVTASAALTARQLVNVYSSGGSPAVQPADASAGKPANGFVLAAVASGGVATVYAYGQIPGFTGLAAGPYYLSDTTPGGLSATPVTTSGNLYQQVGFAVSATVFMFFPQMAFARA